MGRGIPDPPIASSIEPMSEGVIRWGDPPPMPSERAPAPPWSLIAYQLRHRPGEWGLVSEDGHPKLPARIKHGVSWWAPAGAFEVTTRGVDGRMHVWVRYVGAGDSPQPHTPKP